MRMHKAYAGFIYGIKDIYKVAKNDNNNAKINVTDLDGNVHRVEVLDTDSNGDSIKDTNSTCVKNGFIYVDLDQDTLSSIAKIELIDCDGTVFASVDANLDSAKSSLRTAKRSSPSITPISNRTSSADSTTRFLQKTSITK